MPPSRLFRPEAIAFQRDTLSSGAPLPVPPSASALTWLLLALVSTALGVLASGSYARKESAPGFLAPTIGVAKVVPPRVGLVVAVAVSEGELVEAGAPLLTVQVGQTDDSGSDVDSSVLQSLARQRASLLQQIELEQAKTAAERKQMQHRIDALGGESPRCRTNWQPSGRAPRSRTTRSSRCATWSGKATSRLSSSSAGRTICWHSARTRLHSSARSSNGRAR